MKILVGYNGEESDRSVLEAAKSYAGLLKAQVCVVNCMEQPNEVAVKEVDRMAKITKAFDDITEEFNAAGITCFTSLLVNRLTFGENIVKTATEKKTDLIIIGVRLRSKVGKLLFGSTAQFVILEAPCPVLTIK